MKEWSGFGNVTIGGPAIGTRGDAFVPGMYLKNGYVITSRGCPNNCWFCSVPKREGQLRELEITQGWNVLDDNLLACSQQHIWNVFCMLRRQRHRPSFTGGLEAKRMTPWIASELKSMNPESVFFAYDTPDDFGPLCDAAEMLWDAGFIKGSHAIRCYVLCGYPKDSMNAADIRMRQSVNAGFMPMAMLWRDKNGNADYQWKKFQRLWARPAIIASRMKEQSA